MSSRRRVLWLALATLALGMLASQTGSGAEGGDVVLVLNEKNEENPTVGEAKRLFLGATTFWPGNVAVRLFVRPAASPAGIAFFRAIEVVPSRFKRLWQEKQLSGQGSVPETIADPAALSAKIAADPGAIGVALQGEIPADTPGVRLVPLR